MWKAIIPGIISSLLAILIVEVYLLVKSRILLRALKEVLSLHSRSCFIIAPIYHQDLQQQLIHYRVAYSFGHVFELCHRLKVDAKLVPFHRMSEVAEAEDVFSIGGPVSNKLTELYLRRYLPSFQFIHQEGCNDSQFAIPLTEGGYFTGFKIGDELFTPNAEDDYGILIKITEKELDQNRTVHLLFGWSGQGAAGAAYYLWKYHKTLHGDFGAKRYCVVIRVPRTESYKTISKTCLNRTEIAFASVEP